MPKPDFVSPTQPRHRDRRKSEPRFLKREIGFAENDVDDRFVNVLNELLSRAYQQLWFRRINGPTNRVVVRCVEKSDPIKPLFLISILPFDPPQTGLIKRVNTVPDHR